MVMVMEWRKGKLVWQPRIMYLERWSQHVWKKGKRWDEEVRVYVKDGGKEGGHARICRARF